MDKRPSILKNSIFLFIRMIVTLVVSLYTVRVLLEVLGIVDYGIYNLVYGVITGISFVSISLATAAQRFMSHDLGLKKFRRLSFTFSTIFNLFFIFGLVVGFVMFSFGSQIVHQINIPINRIDAALRLLQITSVTFFFTLIVIPLNALIISYEKMKFFSYLTIFDVTAKLLVIYMLKIISYDPLIVYGLFLLLISCLNFLIYALFVRYSLKDVKYFRTIVRSRFKEIFNFFKWSLFGSLTTVANDQGVNIVLNLFFGPAITGSRAIANRVVNVLSQLSNTVFIAVSPQIVKSFASKDFDYTRKLILGSSKLTLYLILLVVIPLYINMEFILNLWLKTISSDIIIFTQASMFFVLLSCLENPLTQLVRAYGEIKTYQIAVGVITLLIIPIAYLFFYYGAKPIAIIWIMNIIYFIALFIRIYIVNLYLKINVRSYIWEIIIKTIVISSVPIIIHHLLVNQIYSIISWKFRLVEAGAFYILFIILVFLVGLSSYERGNIVRFFRNKLR